MTKYFGDQRETSGDGHVSGRHSIKSHQECLAYLKHYELNILRAMSVARNSKLIYLPRKSVLLFIETSKFFGCGSMV